MILAKQVLALHYWGYTHADKAELLGIQVNTVRQHYWRGMHREAHLYNQVQKNKQYKDKIKETYKIWKENNPEKLKQYAHTRKCRAAGVEPNNA